MSTVTLHLTMQQQQWLDEAARILSEKTGLTFSHRAIVMRLLEHGLPQFERELEQLREKKRNPFLRLVGGTK